MCEKFNTMALHDLDPAHCFEEKRLKRRKTAAQAARNF
jgi:hypothetical protein